MYNLLGERVATLVDAVQPEGSHSVRFEAPDLHGGTYLYRLSAGSYVQMRKMVLVR